MGRSGAQYAQLGIVNSFSVQQNFNNTALFHGLSLARVNKTGAYSAAANDSIILCDATTAPFTVTLPLGTAGSHTWFIKKTDASANAVTVQGATGNIDGAASIVMASQNEAIWVTSDGTNGWIIGQVAATIL